MLTYKDQTKARFPLSLDGRGARGEGAFLILSSFIFALLSAAPAAQADNECGLQIDPGNPETLSCPPGDYDGAGTNPGPGITYTSDGDLTLEVPDDSVDLNVVEEGVNVTAGGGDSIFWDSSAFVSGDITGTGIVLDYASSTGAIGIVTGGDVLGTGDATHGIRAVSTGGAIDIETNGAVSSDQYGIQALSDSGNVSIETNGSVFGDEFGIQAETGGSGTLDIVVGDTVDIDSTTGVAAIDATTGTGLLTIDVVSTGTTDTQFEGVRAGSVGSAIRIDAGGDAQIDIGEGRRVSAGTGSTSSGTALNLTAAGQTTVNNAGLIAGVGDSMAIQAAGGSLVLNNTNEIDGTLDFSSLADGYIFNNNAGAVWEAGQLFTDSPRRGNLGTGEFNNAGTIELSRGNYISAPGTTFTGTGDSVLDMSVVILDGNGQPDCTSPTVAGCLDLTGGTTAGQTAILINTRKLDGDDPFAKSIDKPLNPGIVLVDVNGGSSEADHFVLHPDSIAEIDQQSGPGTDLEEVAIYEEDPVYGAVLDTGGLFDYALLYNSGTQQHILSSVPQREAVEYAASIQGVLSVWHTTSDAVAGRQADLRTDSDRGGWVRVVGEQTERNAAPRLTTYGNTFVYDMDYSLSTGAIIAGFDMWSNDNYVIGLHGGFVSSSIKFDDSSRQDKISGVTVGTYGSWWNEAGLTLDGTFNANFLPTLDHSVSGQENSKINVQSYGARVEAGWRLPLLNEALYVQPLATAAYVDADIEDLDLRFYDASFEDTKSSRAALGARLGGEAEMNNGKLGYWLTVRAWEEFGGEDSGLRFAVQGGDDLVIEDRLDGSFEEVGFGVEATNGDGTLSGYVSGGAKFGDDTDSYNFSVGIRKNW